MRFKILIIILILIIAAGFYFRGGLARLWDEKWPMARDLLDRIGIKIGDFERVSVESLLNKIHTQVSAPPPLRATKESAGAALTKSGVIKWTNSQRNNNGSLPALVENSELDAAALVKAQDMFKRQYFAHESPAGVGPSDLAKSADYDFLMIGENLALGNFEDDQGLVRAWMDSPGHRANILNNRYQEIGVAVLKGIYEGKTTWIAVQEFGLPASACPRIDESLKSLIDSSKKEIGGLSASLDAMKAEMNALLKARDLSAYNQKIAQYNQLVKQYNDFVAQSKSLVDQYNAQVRELNACSQ